MEWALIRFEKIYIHIDHGPQNELNSQVAIMAKSFSDNHPNKVLVKLQSNNLGSCFGPIAAFRWFFENVEYGFVFEEDCLPNENFSVSLDDIPNSSICCFSNFSSSKATKVQYKKSSLFNSWGWAAPSQIILPFLSDFDSQTTSDLSFRPSFIQKYFRYLDKIHCKKEKKTWWDFQLIAYLLHNGIAVYRPTVNMIDNVGINKFASHTSHYDPHKAKFKPFNKFKQYFCETWHNDPIFIGDVINWLKFGICKTLFFMMRRK